MDDFKHIPVMLDECINGLNIKENGIYVDGTLGGAGHSSKICESLTNGTLIGIDRDPYAINKAKERLKEYTNNIILVNDNYANITSILNNLHIEKIDGMLLDLGVSSFQLDDVNRGFSYRYNAPLDMRMNQGSGISAKDIINEYTEEKLAKIFFEYGEERYSRSIAKNICKARDNKQIETTFELVDIIKASMPPKALRESGHPAKRTFQAIRIEVNGELEIIKDAIKAAIERLNSGGRLVIITFHSLEDRLVKTAFAESAQGCTCPRDFPVCVCGNKPKVKIITKKPILPRASELKENSRSSSAKLRIAERL